MSIEGDKRGLKIPEGIEGRGTKTGSEGHHAQGSRSHELDVLDQATRNSELFRNVSVPARPGSALSEADQRERNSSLWK